MITAMDYYQWLKYRGPAEQSSTSWTGIPTSKNFHPTKEGTKEALKKGRIVICADPTMDSNEAASFTAGLFRWMNKNGLVFKTLTIGDRLNLDGQEIQNPRRNKAILQFERV